MNTPETKNTQLLTIHATKSGRLLLTISTSRKFLSLKEISSCNRKFRPVTGNFVRKLPPQIGYFFLWQDILSFEMKILHGTGILFLWQKMSSSDILCKEMSSCDKKFLVWLVRLVRIVKLRLNTSFWIGSCVRLELEGLGKLG